MGVRVGAFYPGGFGEKFCRVMIDATTVAGAIAVRSTATNSSGEVVDGTTTGATDFMGVYAEAVTFSTTQADYDGFVSDIEGTVGMICDPFQVFAFKISGGATVNTALNSTSPANILTNTSASSGGTVVTAAEVGTVSMAGGIVIGRTGNNAGLVRRASAHSNSTSTTVEIPFPRALAVSDTFYRFPYSLAGHNMQTTTDLTQADGTIATGTGAPFNMVAWQGKLGGVEVDLSTDTAYVFVVALDHNFNSIS